MNASLKREIDSCVTELNSIVRELYAVSNDVSSSITGMNTRKYTNGLEYSASRYSRAASKLKKIR